MVALHNAVAASIAVSGRLSSLGYSGEHFDAKAAQQYLRARFYNPANGRFNRLDPFAGNMQDPQSLHKYAYVHGDPISNYDPTGEFSLGGISVGNAIRVGMRAVKIGAAYAARQGAISAGETTLEFIIGKIIGAAIGIKFDPTPEDIELSFATNFVANVATAGIGSTTKKAILLRNLLDFAIRMISDVGIKGESIYWAAAVNLMSMGASGVLLAKYGQKIFGKSVGRFGGCFVEGTQVVTEHGELHCHQSDQSHQPSGAAVLQSTTKSIEDIALGTRVVTEPVEVINSEFINEDPVQEHWRMIRLNMWRVDGTTIEAEILRPLSWIHNYQLQIGDTIELPFSELRTTGYAKILEITDCPIIESGSGEVVIGRFKTEKASNLVSMTLMDGSKIEGTSNHLVWSDSQNEWIELGRFEIGETVSTLDGSELVIDVKQVTNPATVYNLEICNDHVYRILNSGVLVHNADYVPDSSALFKNADEFADTITDINKATDGRGVLMGSSSPLSAVQSASYYSEVKDQAAAIFKSISHGHMFHNGNKRTAVNTLIAFAGKTGLKVTKSYDELMDVATDVAAGNVTDIAEIAARLVD